MIMTLSYDYETLDMIFNANNPAKDPRNNAMMGNIILPYQEYTIALDLNRYINIRYINAEKNITSIKKRIPTVNANDSTVTSAV